MRKTPVKVRQATLDAMNKRGMAANIAHANSGKANEEELEAARRYYGKRITGTALKATAEGKLKATTEKALPRQPLPKPTSSSGGLGKSTGGKGVGKGASKYAVRAV
jgi:hypothetical protein